MNGIEMNRYEVGRIYDLPASLAMFLIAQGWALSEMRLRERRKRAMADYRQGMTRERRQGQDRRSGSRPMSPLR